VLHSEYGSPFHSCGFALSSAKKIALLERLTRGDSQL